MKLLFLLGICMFSSLSAQQQLPRIGVGVIVIKEGKILLGQRVNSYGSGDFAPPGGHLEFGETIEECATRELLEEAGLDALAVQLSPCIVQEPERGKKHYITFFVLVDAFAGEPKALEPDKCTHWDWFDLTDLPSPLFPTLERFLDQFKAS